MALEDPPNIVMMENFPHQKQIFNRSAILEIFHCTAHDIWMHVDIFWYLGIGLWCRQVNDRTHKHVLKAIIIVRCKWHKLCSFELQVITFSFQLLLITFSAETMCPILMSSLEMSTARTAAAAAAAFCPFLEATSFTSGNTRYTHKVFMHPHHYKLCIELQDYTFSFIALVHGQRKEYLPHTVFRIVRIIYSMC